MREISEDTRARMRAAKLGKPMNALQREKQIARWTPELRERMRQIALANPTRHWLGKKRGPIPQDVRDKMSAATKGRRLSLGMTGKTHSTDTRRRMSQMMMGRRPSAESVAKMAASKIGTRLGPRHPHSAATRAKISAATKLKTPRGRNHPRWGKSSPHIRRAEYNGCLFRSSYEVRFAKALDRRGMAWEYEQRRFDLGECTYMPDFFIPSTGAFWEIKGWFTDVSKNKVRLFRERYPDIPLIVATNDVVKMMERSA